MKVTDSQKCCGCSACADICPKQCISMTYDEYGFYVPKINEQLCINCKACITICPANNAVEKNDILSIYKGFANNIESEENQASTSGAAFPLFAENIISRNGYVIGAAFEDGCQNVAHVVCEDMSQVNTCRGSKYIQSKTQGIYRKTKALLKSGKPVLFSGTPCQIAALKAYLKDNPPNLFCIDFVCHGVASTSFYQNYLKALAKDAPVSYVGFRDKCGYYLNSKFRIITADNCEIANYSFPEEQFGKAFANNLLSRVSCGECVYATSKRVADITLADNTLFNTEKEKQYGSSFIFINSPKGEALLQCVKSNLSIEELQKEEVIPRIMHFQHPAIPHRDRDKLLKACAKCGYSEASKYISDYIPKRDLKSRILHKCTQVISIIRSAFQKRS